MKRLNTLLAILVFSSMGIPTSSVADVKNGHKIYKKKLQKSCKLPGSLFARKHTQDEWEELMEDNKFKEAVKKICPTFALDRLSDSQWKHLYDFSYQFGIGGEVPNGCDPK
ncbi:MAG: hypothetical protein L3J43_09330 [Sulfurovum sp.]|nr:hypothetical protein [Sulfurovum sp.]